MWEWTIKKAECRRIDAFELWCWRRLLRVPWTSGRSNQSILKISPGCSLEGLILKLKLQYLATWCRELTHLKRPWCWERLRAGGEGETEDEMVGWHHQQNGHGFVWTSGVGDGQGCLACCSSWGRKESDTTERLNWTELNWLGLCNSTTPCCQHWDFFFTFHWGLINGRVSKEVLGLLDWRKSPFGDIYGVAVAKAATYTRPTFHTGAMWSLLDPNTVLLFYYPLQYWFIYWSLSSSK